MVTLVGGAPRTGKTMLSQQVAAQQRTNWISTDLLKDILRVKTTLVPHIEWNAPETITSTAEWFFPYLERFVWGASSMADHYIIEGVDFLPVQAAQLAAQFEIRAVFLGRSSLTLAELDQFTGRSRGYAALAEDVKRQITRHVPMHSEIVRQEAKRYLFPYFDMSGDFSTCLHEAETALISESR
jgi:hypothetical protein